MPTLNAKIASQRRRSCVAVDLLERRRHRSRQALAVVGVRRGRRSGWPSSPLLLPRRFGIFSNASRFRVLAFHVDAAGKLPSCRYGELHTVAFAANRRLADDRVCCLSPCRRRRNCRRRRRRRRGNKTKECNRLQIAQSFYLRQQKLFTATRFATYKQKRRLSAQLPHERALRKLDR